MGNANKKEVQKVTINKNHWEKCQEKIIGNLLWAFILFEPQQHLWKEGPRVQRSAKFPLGSNAMMPTTVGSKQASWWLRGERLDSKTPAGDALWQNQTWQAEASTSAVISRQKSWVTCLVCSWDATVCQRKSKHMFKPKGENYFEWSRWRRRPSIPDETRTAFPCYGTVWWNASWSHMHGECLLYFEKLDLGGLPQNWPLA